MKIVRYSPERFSDLCVVVEKMNRGHALAIEKLINHYYHDNSWCQLHLAIGDDSHSIVGTIGFESIPFLLNGKAISIGFGNNFHTLEEGCGGLLFMKWVRNQPYSMVYNCSKDTQKLTAAQRWKQLEGIQSLSYNAPAYRNPRQSSFTHFLKTAIKRLLRKPPLQKIVERNDFLPHINVSVTEEKSFHPDMLEFESSFDFRVAPDLDYLNWRFSTNWNLFSYRIFSIKCSGEYRGFVVLHDTPNQVYIAHADGSNPLELVKAELLALAQVSGKRPSFLCSSVPEITDHLNQIGFRTNSAVPCVQFSSSLPITEIKRPMINFAVGDNDLRTDFMHRS
ncbi:MAG: hypothetical protein L3J39_07705 [Verrucomicrobiales bacterium]|nr:hypothetical protein [Verrucomicrobiales bacterium]